MVSLLMETQNELWKLRMTFTTQIAVLKVRGLLSKAGYNPDQPRDDRGRWSASGGSGGSSRLEEIESRLRFLGEKDNPTDEDYDEEDQLDYEKSRLTNPYVQDSGGGWGSIPYKDAQAAWEEWSKYEGSDETVLNDIINRFSLPTDTVLYRGVWGSYAQQIANAKPGDTIELGRVSSWSEDPDVSLSYAQMTNPDVGFSFDDDDRGNKIEQMRNLRNAGNHVLLSVQAKAGTTGMRDQVVNDPEMQQIEQAREWMLPNNTKLVVRSTSVRIVGGYPVTEVEAQVARLKKGRTMYSLQKFRAAIRKLHQVAKAGYNPDQPRDDKGRWSGGGGSGTGSASDRLTYETKREEARLAGGHPKSINEVSNQELQQHMRPENEVGSLKTGLPHSYSQHIRVFHGGGNTYVVASPDAAGGQDPYKYEGLIPPKKVLSAFQFEATYDTPLAQEARLDFLERERGFMFGGPTGGGGDARDRVFMEAPSGFRGGGHIAVAPNGSWEHVRFDGAKEKVIASGSGGSDLRNYVNRWRSESQKEFRSVGSSKVGKAIDKLRAIIKAGYNPDQPRDDKGRWSSGGGGSGIPRNVERALQHGIEWELSDAPHDDITSMQVDPDELETHFRYTDEPKDSEFANGKPIDWQRVERYLKTLSEGELKQVGLITRGAIDDEAEWNAAKAVLDRGGKEGEYASAALASANNLLWGS